MSINYTPNNTFIFSFVRMNPPTPGHLLLIKTLIDKAVELGSEKVYVITSSSVDGKNPIPCSVDTIPTSKNKADGNIIAQMTQNNSIYKSMILEEMISTYKRQLVDKLYGDDIKREKIQNLRVIVLCSTGNPFGFIGSVIYRDFIQKGIPKVNMFFVVGRDRADFLDTIVDNFRTRDYINSIDGEILGREGMSSLKNVGMGSRTIADINPSEYSASFVRGLVKNNKKEEFNQVYNRYLSPEDIDKMYQSIQLGIGMKPPASKSEDENPKSRYFDGRLLPIIPIMGSIEERPTKRPRFGGKRNSRRNSRKNSKTKIRKNKRHTRKH
jgi:hypothetical protein